MPVQSLDVVTLKAVRCPYCHRYMASATPPTRLKMRCQRCRAEVDVVVLDSVVR